MYDEASSVPIKGGNVVIWIRNISSVGRALRKGQRSAVPHHHQEAKKQGARSGGLVGLCASRHVTIRTRCDVQLSPMLKCWIDISVAQDGLIRNASNERNK